MDLTRRSLFVYGLLIAIWGLVVAWQVEEHVRFREYEKTALRKRSKSIANTLGAVIRGSQFRGATFGRRLQPVLDDLVSGTNDFTSAGEVVSVALLNMNGEPLASAGRPIDPEQKEIIQAGERWGPRAVTFVFPIQGVSVSSERGTNTQPPIFLEVPTNSMREGRSSRRGPRPPDEGPPPPATNSSNSSTSEVATAGVATNSQPPTEERRPPPEGEFRPRRPPWLRGISDQDYQAFVQKHELHSLFLSIPLDTYYTTTLRDLWLRCVIGFFATLSVIGSALAWRALAATSDLQLRLVRASEQNTHLKEMNLAAAGLAHETRNPLNIIRGLAHMIAKRPESSPEVQAKSKQITEEADKVAAQLNEFINYSRPREVRRTAVSVPAVATEVARALSYDLEEKKINLQIKAETLNVEADEQMLRQALFNLILNAIQAANGNGEIQVVAEKRGPSEALLEVRDNGPGVPPENRAEIFKPYFTTQKTGTGLGLAVVQQIVLAHGWEIECLPNDPQGAVFRITHLKPA
jgi:signal transduction histidine kinase